MEITDDEPGFVMMNLRKLQDWQTFLLQQKKPELKQWEPIPMRANMALQDSRLASWLNKNMFTARQRKQKQLYIHGPTNMVCPCSSTLTLS